MRGPDLEGFVRFCDEQAALQVREGEAATAEEGRDAIVLMTVHAAKGLEFDVVALADCGRERASRQTRDILVDAGGRIALRAVDPATGLLRPGARLRRRGRAGSASPSGRRRGGCSTWA